MPNLNGLAATRQITKRDPNQKVIILTVTDAEEVIREALEAGARGFVLKSDAARDLVTAIEALQVGRTFFTPRVSEMLLNGYLRGSGKQTPQLPTLTSREKEIVQLLAEGKSTKEVASVLNPFDNEEYHTRKQRQSHVEFILLEILHDERRPCHDHSDALHRPG